MENSAFRSLINSAQQTYVEHKTVASGASERGSGEDAQTKRKRRRPRHDSDRTDKQDKDEGPTYRDLAAERRAREAESGTSEAAELNVDIERSKFLGGDAEHTHLVKGLDFSLLNKIKRETERERQDARAHSADAASTTAQLSSSSGKAPALAAPRASKFAQSVLSAALADHSTALFAAAAQSGSAAKQPGASSSSSTKELSFREQMRRTLVHGGSSVSSAAARYAPGRLTFTVDLRTNADDAGYSEHPRVTLRPAAECPDTDPGVFDALPAALLEAVSEVAVAVRQGGDAMRKLRRQRRRRERELAEEAAVAEAAKQAAVQQPASASGKGDEDEGGDEDDDVFGDVGEYNFGEPLKPSGLPDVVESVTPAAKSLPAGAAGSGERAMALVRAGALKVEPERRELGLHALAGPGGDEGDGAEDDIVEGYVEDGRDDGYGDMGVSGQGGALTAQAMAQFYATVNKAGGVVGGSATAASRPEMLSEKDLAKRKAIADKRRFEKELKAVEGILQRRQDGGESGGPENPTAKRAKPGRGGFVE